MKIITLKNDNKIAFNFLFLLDLFGAGSLDILSGGKEVWQWTSWGRSGVNSTGAQERLWTLPVAQLVNILPKIFQAFKVENFKLKTLLHFSKHSSLTSEKMFSFHTI